MGLVFPLAADPPMEAAVVHDLGNFPARNAWTGIYLLRNEGEEPLVVTHVETNPGRFEALVGGEPIPPGEAVPIHFRLPLGGRIGPVRASATFTLMEEGRDPTRVRTVRIALTGWAVPVASWMPTGLEALGLRKGEVRVLEADVLPRDGKRTTLRPLDVAGVEVAAVPAGDHLHVWVTVVEADLPPGAGGNLTLPLRLEPDPDPEAITCLQVRWTRKPSA
jgi:hypothetical protein